MKRTFDALSGGSASDCAQSVSALQTDESKKIIEHHLKKRQLILKKLGSMLQQPSLNPVEVHDFNHDTTDYIINSQFVVLPPLCHKLDETQRNCFIDNSVAFSYMTNILAEQPTSRVVISRLVELFTDRFIYEDELFGTLQQSKVKKFG